MTSRTISATLHAFALLLITAGVVHAQSNPRYVRFPGVPASVKGAFYVPDAPAQAPHVGIVLMHRTSNFMHALACTELSARGFAVLCMNPRSDNNEAAVRFETIPLDVKAGVEFLKKQPGITRVVLWGWSGGGATMTLYQSVAENGPSVCQGPAKLVQCGNDLAGLPPADGLILVDAPRQSGQRAPKPEPRGHRRASSRTDRPFARSVQREKRLSGQRTVCLFRCIQEGVLQGAGRSDESVDCRGTRSAEANAGGHCPS